MAVPTRGSLTAHAPHPSSRSLGWEALGVCQPGASQATLSWDPCLVTGPQPGLAALASVTLEFPLDPDVTRVVGFFFFFF